MVAYILSLGSRSNTGSSLPTSGEYIASDSAALSTTGAVKLQASYTDRGANGLLGIAAETTVVLRSPTVVMASGELSDGVEKRTVEGVPTDVAVVNKSGSFVKFARVDLTGISSIVFSVLAVEGGRIEVRVDSAGGEVLGMTDVVPASPDSGARFYSVALPATQGPRDLYFVFTSGTGDEQLRLAVSTVRFQHGSR
jgi:cytochrome c